MGGSFNNTVGGDQADNIYVIEASSFTGAFINSGDGPSTSINIPLTAGTYTFTFFAGGGDDVGCFGMNLFFNGNGNSPGISVSAPLNSPASLQSCPAAPCSADSGSTMSLFEAAVPGAGTVSFTSGSTPVTLQSYVLYSFGTYNIDRVGAYDDVPDGQPDHIGQFTIQVGCQVTALGATPLPGVQSVGTVNVYAGGPYSLNGQPTGSYAIFTSTAGGIDGLPGTLSAAEATCGVNQFDWQQTVNVLPSPSPFFPANPTLANWPPNVPFTAGPPPLGTFPDPPNGGYTCEPLIAPPGSCPSYTAATATRYPYYWDVNSTTNPWSLVPNETEASLLFVDYPGDPCLPGGDPGLQAVMCNGSSAPPFSDLQFTTQLVGIRQDGSVVPNIFTWSWTSTFNGECDSYAGCGTGTGGIAVISNYLPVDPSSGSGGTTITNINGTALLPNPPSGTACNGMYNGTFNGSITVSNGQTCTFVGGTINGQVTVTGGTLVLSGTTVTQNVQINDGAFFIGPSASIEGNLQIQYLPTGPGQNQVCGTTVSGNLQFQNNGTAVQIGSASAACTGNTVGGNLLVDSNTASTQLFNNNITLNLNCAANSSITGGGNRAKGKNGQCAAF